MRKKESAQIEDFHGSSAKVCPSLGWKECICHPISLSAVCQIANVSLDLDHSDPHGRFQQFPRVTHVG